MEAKVTVGGLPISFKVPEDEFKAVIRLASRYAVELLSTASQYPNLAPASEPTIYLLTDCEDDDDPDACLSTRGLAPEFGATLISILNTETFSEKS